MELPFLAGKTHRHKIGMEVRAMKKTWGRQNDGKGGDWSGRWEVVYSRGSRFWTHVGDPHIQATL